MSVLRVRASDFNLCISRLRNDERSVGLSSMVLRPLYLSVGLYSLIDEFLLLTTTEPFFLAGSEKSGKNC